MILLQNLYALVATSRAEVASSSSRIGDLRSSARAMERRCGLSFGETAAAFLNLAVDAVRQLFHEIPGAGPASVTSMISSSGGIRLHISHIVGDRAGKHGVSLRHIGEQLSGGRGQLQHIRVPAALRRRHGKLLPVVSEGTRIRRSMVVFPSPDGPNQRDDLMRISLHERHPRKRQCHYGRNN